MCGCEARNEAFQLHVACLMIESCTAAFFFFSPTYIIRLLIQYYLVAKEGGVHYNNTVYHYFIKNFLHMEVHLHPQPQRGSAGCLIITSMDSHTRQQGG
jgi:hypothetical protein